MKKITALVFLISLMFFASGAQSTTHDFYKGQTVRILVGFSAGGGFDTYTRVIGRHLGRHIPGNPAIIVENMPGAGSLIAANHLYKVAKPDGLTMANFIGGLLIGQVLGRPGIEFDARKFEYVGVPVMDTWVCALTKATGITSAENWLAAKTAVKLGGIGAGTGLDDAPKVLRAALNLPLQLVSGYKGTSDIRLAAENGEVGGGCGWSWDSVKATWTRAIESGEIVIPLQMRDKPHPELQKVPLAINFAKTEEARQLIRLGTHEPPAINRPYILPPGTPKERVQAVRQAFMETLKDPQFLADAKKSKLDIEPLTGEEVEKTVQGLFKLEPGVVARLSDILK